MRKENPKSLTEQSPKRKVVIGERNTNLQLEEGAPMLCNVLSGVPREISFLDSQEEFQDELNEQRISEFKMILTGKGYAHATILNRLQSVRHFIARFPDPEIVTQREIHLLMAELREEGWGRTERGPLRPSSVKQVLMSVRLFYKILKLTDPTAEIAAPKMNRVIPPYLREEHIGQLIKAPTLDCWAGYRDRALLALFCYGGLRLEEIRQLSMRNIDFSDYVIIIRNTKNGDDRPIMMNRIVRETLKAYIDVRPNAQSDICFLNRRSTDHSQGGPMSKRAIEDSVQRYGTACGFFKVYPHLLRHSMATLMLRKTKNIRVVQRALGHRSIASTEIYTHIADDELRAAFDATDPVKLEEVAQ